MIKTMLDNGATTDEIMSNKFFSFPKSQGGKHARNANRNGAKTADGPYHEDKRKVVQVTPIHKGDDHSTFDHEELDTGCKEEVNTVMKIGLKSLQKFEKQSGASSKRSRSSP